MMTDKFILRCMKYMLKEKKNHIVIRTIMHILELGDTTTINEPMVFSDQEGILHNHFLEVGQEQFIEDLKAVATFEIQHVKVDAVSTTKKQVIYRLTHPFGEAYFSTPAYVGRKKVVKAKDTLERDILEVFNYWLQHIGSIKTIFKRTPTLTTSKAGRHHFIKAALAFATVEELKLAIDGCLRSPHHMGFKINFKTSHVTKTDPYCDFQSIIRSRDRVEKMITHSTKDHYEKQIEEAKARSRVRNIGFGEGVGDMEDLVGTGEIPLLERNIAPKHEENAEDSFQAWLQNQ